MTQFGENWQAGWAAVLEDGAMCVFVVRASGRNGREIEGVAGFRGGRETLY